MKKIMLSTISFMVIIFNLFCICVNAYNNTEYFASYITIDNAPIVFVEDESQLPQSMFNSANGNVQENSLTTSGNNIGLIEQYQRKLLLKQSLHNSGIAYRYLIENIIMGIVQEPQSTNFYCGYACLQSLLEYHGIFMNQEDIASEAFYENQALAWFAGINSQATNINYYPAATYLNSKLDHDYSPYNSWFGNYTSSIMFNKIKSTIDVEEGVLACGVSDGRANDGSRLPNYPANESISHWIIIDGYYWETTTETPTKLSYVDPAKSDAISWSGAITAYGDTTIENIYKFTSSRGIIY